MINFIGRLTVICFDYQQVVGFVTRFITAYLIGGV